MPTPPRKSKTAKSKKSPGDPAPKNVYAVREASKREVGDVADKITRAPKKR
jgi:hypothetical protein